MDKIKGVSNGIKLYVSTNKVKIKHYLISSIVTFVTGFGYALYKNFEKFDFVSFENGAWVGLIFVALRAGAKALLESWLKNKIKV